MNAPTETDLDAVFQVELPPRPYPGLRPFDKGEWPIFFGRERMIDEVVSRLIDQQLIFVHGDSGSGKSSLVRAGVLARLEQESARSGMVWRTAAMTPGDAPLRHLAEAFAAVDGHAGDEDRITQIRRVLNFGGEAVNALAELLQRSPGRQLCVLLDQFEELFAFARRRGAHDARQLASLIVAFAERPPGGIFLAVTMRSEFLGACAHFPGLAEAVNRTQYLLPRMAHADLIRAIREPAALYDGSVSLDLADRLVTDVGSGQDQLPLIQHGLMLLHRRAVPMADPSPASHGLAEGPASWRPGRTPRWRLTAAMLGPNVRLVDLLSTHADAVADAVEPMGAGRLVEDIFRALTEMAHGQAIRRPQTLAQLVRVTSADEARVRAILDVFRAEGVSFVRPYGTVPLAASDLVDISHEALMRGWRRLADAKDGWLFQEFRNGLIWQSLLIQAEAYERDATSVLSPAATQERKRWIERRNAAWAERYGGGWSRVQALLEASEAAAVAAERARLEQERIQAVAGAQQAKLRQMQIGLLVISLLALLAGGLAIWTFELMQEAEIAREEAEIARARAEDARAEAQSDAGALRAQALELEQALAEAAAFRDQANRAQQIAATNLVTTVDRESVSRTIVTVEMLIDELSSETDPFTSAVIVQSIANLSHELSVEQSRRVLSEMLDLISTTTNPGSLLAISDALVYLIPRIEPNQRARVLTTLLNYLADTTDQDVSLALSNVVFSFISYMPSNVEVLQAEVLQAIDTLDADAARLVFFAIAANRPRRDTGVDPEVRDFLGALANRASLPPARLFIHIATEDQRSVARDLELHLRENALISGPIVVPGIELIGRFTGRSAVRCFRDAECASEGRALVDLLNQLLVTPSVRLEDLSARFEYATDIRPRTYELWFGPGPIELR